MAVSFHILTRSSFKKSYFDAVKHTEQESPINKTIPIYLQSGLPSGLLPSALRNAMNFLCFSPHAHYILRPVVLLELIIRMQVTLGEDLAYTLRSSLCNFSITVLHFQVFPSVPAPSVHVAPSHSHAKV